MIQSSAIFFSLLYLSQGIHALTHTSNLVLEVCSTCKLTRITEAINQASPGAIITVQKGLYKEGRLIIDKPLSLIGIDNPVLDGDKKEPILIIKKANDVKISGFIIQNTGMSYIEELAGIKVIESKNCVIENNQLLDTTYGIYLDNSEACRISHNLIHGQAISETSAGNAVHVWYGSNHIIEHNQLTGHRDGVYLEFTKGTQVRDNIVQRNIRYGLHFMQSNQTGYYRNTFSENGAGAAVMYSKEVKMYENHFIGNTGPSAYAILLKEVSDSIIRRNFFSNNTVAIFMEGSNRSKFENNNISSNGWGLRIMGDCENNEFIHNNFISNTFDVTTNADHSWNIFKNNYWSQYDGYDLNHDGIGDRPYRPVSLSSIITERFDSSYILMNSFFFTVMDQVERALPTLIPEPLKDEFPIMRALKIEPGDEHVE